MTTRDPFMAGFAIDATEYLLETAKQRIDATRERLALSQDRAAAAKIDIDTMSRHLQSLRTDRQA